MANYSVFGVGNPLMDMIGHVSAEQLERVGATPGTMSLVNADRAASIAANLSRAERRPGGSCANTLRGLAWLARQADGDTTAPPVMTGVVGDDAVGRDIVRRLGGLGVATRLGTHRDEPTGISVVLVTPDGQRTMFTALGACQALSVDHLDRTAIAASSCFYATAYLWGPPGPRQALRTAAAAAGTVGAPVAFDVADMGIVGASGAELLAWIPAAVDLLFANEQEARMLAGLITGVPGTGVPATGVPADGDPEAACAALAGLAPTVVVKLGAAGCLVWERGAVAARVPGVRADVLDTTGAGDSFAAGYLYAMLAGGSAAEAAALGNRVAAAIVEVSGCDYSAVSADFPV